LHRQTGGLFEFVRFVLGSVLKQRRVGFQDRSAGTKNDKSQQARNDDAKDDEEQKRAGSV
jgi:hypothetical protein